MRYLTTVCVTFNTRWEIEAIISCYAHLRATWLSFYLAEQKLPVCHCPDRLLFIFLFGLAFVFLMVSWSQSQNILTDGGSGSSTKLLCSAKSQTRPAFGESDITTWVSRQKGLADGKVKWWKYSKYSFFFLTFCCCPCMQQNITGLPTTVLLLRLQAGGLATSALLWQQH